MAKLENPYCEVDDVRGVLRNNIPSAEGEIIGSINAASRYIDQWLGRDFKFHDYSVTPFRVLRDHCFDDEIVLPYSPIITLTSLIYAGQAYVLDTDYYLPEDNRGRKRVIKSLTGAWPDSYPPSNLILVYGTFGYPQTDRTGAYSTQAVPAGMPAEIRQAAQQIAALMTGRLQKEVIGVDGSKQAVTENQIPQVIRNILGSRKPII